MIFGRAKEEPKPPAVSLPQGLLIVGLTRDTEGERLVDALRANPSQLPVTVAPDGPVQIGGALAIVSLFQDVFVLDQLLTQASAQRAIRKDGFPVLVIVNKLSKLAELGHWLSKCAAEDRLQGIRLVLAESLSDIPKQILNKLEAVTEPNVIKMPSSPEVECKDFKYFYSITPELRHLVRTMKELAENSITRVYLLGGPGTGKTSIAYYYYLCRAKGNFVTVNLTAESTGNKEAMKSLLCGHVTGAMGGIAAREGALSYAGDGVAFLDESHGVTGVVMQVLMEVLDSGQYLPFGATKKRNLECAVIFASNRSWEALRDLMNLDEHARLGATIVKITDLASREEDMIAVVATALARFSRQCTSWKAATGLSPEAWQAYKDCKWHGNTRTLIRVTEAASIAHALRKNPSELINVEEVQEAMRLWEPTEHESLKVYTSYQTADLA